MMVDALKIVLYLTLIVFVITLIVLSIKLISTLSKVDYLVDDLTKKSKTLDGVFNVIDYTTNKFGTIGESISGYIMDLVKKIFQKRKMKKGEDEDE